MNLSESVGVDATNLVHVALTSNVGTSDTFIRYFWHCCISAMSSSVKYTIVNGDMNLAAFTKATLLPISDAVQSLFTILFTKVGYSGTSVSSKM